MAAKNKQQQKKIVAQAPKSNKKPVMEKIEFLEKLEKWASKHSNILMGLCLTIALIFSLLLFNVKLSDGSDDAVYIEAGYNYAKDFFNYYFTFQAPLYPMFLTIPIAIFGVKLVLLKMFSILFFVLGIFFYFKAFRGRIKNIILIPALFLTALNSLFLYYAGQTFTEAFTLFLSGCFFCTLFTLDDVTKTGTNIKENWKKFLLFGLAAFLMILTRNVAVVIPVVVLIYFLFQKKWLTSLLSLCSFGLFYGLYNGIIRPLFWGHLNVGGFIGSQNDIVWLKNPYNPALGNEDFNGLIVRFLENAKIYSTQLFNITGLKSEAAAPFNYTFAGMLIIFALAALIFSIMRKNKRIWAVLLYVSAFLTASFSSLATSWQQPRLIMIYLPLIAICVFYAFYAFLRIKEMRWLQWTYPVLIVLFLFVNVKKDIGEIKVSLPVLEQNLAGDKYYGLTPDWINYFKACEWAADSLSKEEIIGCRKASMSFIYTNGRHFHSINTVPSLVPDSALRANQFEHRFAATEPQGMFLRTFDSIQPDMKLLAMTDQKSYYVYDIPANKFDFFVDDIKLANKTYLDMPQVLLDSIKTDKNIVISPDLLLDGLRKGGVTYIIDASLRADPSKKTENKITTITRYMNYIQAKYSNIFEKVHQVGKDDEEPAWVYKINYPKE